MSSLSKPIQSQGSPQDPMGDHPQYGETMITLGTLVVSVCDGVIGIVTWVPDESDPQPADRVYQVTWADWEKSLCYDDEFEVLA